MALPIATRCFWPPDSSPGLLDKSPCKPNVSEASKTLFSTSILGNFCALRPNEILSLTDKCGYNA